MYQIQSQFELLIELMQIEHEPENVTNEKKRNSIKLLILGICH